MKFSVGVMNKENAGSNSDFEIINPINVTKECILS